MLGQRWEYLWTNKAWRCILCDVDYLKHLPDESDDRQNVESKNI